MNARHTLTSIAVILCATGTSCFAQGRGEGADLRRIVREEVARALHRARSDQAPEASPRQPRVTLPNRQGKAGAMAPQPGFWAGRIFTGPGTGERIAALRGAGGPARAALRAAERAVEADKSLSKTQRVAALKGIGAALRALERTARKTSRKTARKTEKVNRRRVDVDQGHGKHESNKDKHVDVEFEVIRESSESEPRTYRLVTPSLLVTPRARIGKTRPGSRFLELNPGSNRLLKVDGKILGLEARTLPAGTDHIIHLRRETSGRGHDDDGRPATRPKAKTKARPKTDAEPGKQAQKRDTTII